VDGKTIGDGIAAMDRIADEVLDDSFSTSLGGVSKEFAESGSSLQFAFLLALVLIFLILAAQFESWIDPLVVMFTVPLALAGALITLWLGGHTLNIFSQIGIIVLVGLVTKNGILIVEFANQRKEAGLKKLDAVVDAASQRFRPILMTSLATILGALPIALGLGAASKSRVPMGIAIIGGLLFALLLTLYVVPALYSYMSRELGWKERKQRTADTDGSTAESISE
jgi:multidrug efflux pump